MENREEDEKCGREQFTVFKRIGREGVHGNGSFEVRSEGGERGSQEGVWGREFQAEGEARVKSPGMFEEPGGGLWAGAEWARGWGRR